MSKTGWIVLGILGMFIVALAVYNSNVSNNGDDQAVSAVWHEETTRGNPDAENKFINYTDVTCPHCANFHNAAVDSTFDKDYLDSGKVYMEARVTAMLPNANSARANEAAYCAIDQNKFWEFYDVIVQKFTDDYFSKGIGISPTSPKVPKLDDDYYYDAAKTGKLDVDAMKSCLDSGDMVAKVNSATQRAVQDGVQGVPYFDINNGKYSGSGFGGGYETIQQMMRAGGVN